MNNQDNPVPLFNKEPNPFKSCFNIFQGLGYGAGAFMAEELQKCPETKDTWLAGHLSDFMGGAMLVALSVGFASALSDHPMIKRLSYSIPLTVFAMDEIHQITGESFLSGGTYFDPQDIACGFAGGAAVYLTNKLWESDYNPLKKARDWFERSVGLEEKL